MVTTIRFSFQSLLTVISTPGNKSLYFLFISPHPAASVGGGDIDMDLGRLRVIYSWIMWPLLSHFHNVAAPRRRSPDTRGEYKWLKLSYRRVMIVCKSPRAVCIQRDQTSRGDWARVCVCVRTEPARLPWHTWKPCIQCQAWRGGWGRDNGCVDSRTHTQPGVRKKKKKKEKYHKMCVRQLEATHTSQSDTSKGKMHNRPHAAFNSDTQFIWLYYFLSSWAIFFSASTL